MTYSVSILLRARQDVQQIFDWLAARSEQGGRADSRVSRSRSPPSARINTRPRGRKNRPAIGGRRCLGLARQTNLKSLPDSSYYRYSAIGGLIHGDCRKTGCDQRRPGGASSHRSRSRGGPRSRVHASGCGTHGQDVRRNARAVGNVNLAVPLIRETRDEGGRASPRMRSAFPADTYARIDFTHLAMSSMTRGSTSAGFRYSLGTALPLPFWNRWFRSG